MQAVPGPRKAAGPGARAAEAGARGQERALSRSGRGPLNYSQIYEGAGLAWLAFRLAWVWLASLRLSA